MTPHITDQQPAAEMVAVIGRALQTAINDDREAAVAAVKELSDRWGADGIHAACCAWSDTLVGNVPQWTERARSGNSALPGFMNASSGDRGGVDDVPPRVRWAGRFATARAVMDHDTTEALMYSCTTDAEFGECVTTLLDLCALGLRAGVPADHPSRQGGQRPA